MICQACCAISYAYLPSTLRHRGFLPTHGCQTSVVRHAPRPHGWVERPHYCCYTPVRVQVVFLSRLGYARGPGLPPGCCFWAYAAWEEGPILPKTGHGRAIILTIGVRSPGQQRSAQCMLLSSACRPQSEHRASLGPLPFRQACATLPSSLRHCAPFVCPLFASFGKLCYARLL